jgi:hypothetical protein
MPAAERESTDRLGLRAEGLVRLKFVPQMVAEIHLFVQ